MNKTPDNPHKHDALGGGMKRAIVAFGGSPELKVLRYLRPGYRHCFAFIQSQGTWVMYNPLSIGTEIEVWPGHSETQLRHWLQQNGYRLIDTEIQALRPMALPWAVFSCVEAVKRVLGIRAPWVMTPWQLFKHLNQNIGKKSLTGAIH
ncbi:hypothetical protein V5T82_11005 [Magnetovibrio sp. PR-2]|uniref:hypothetical protein n=1 Tax=Magnetovibrio sp. PR-2 TaxID=3120356 RepID=UPI002FCE09E3